MENHLNYIHRPGGTLSEDEAWGLAALYNSRLLDTWFRAVNGNTQVSATELRAMPLPPRETIVCARRAGKASSRPDGGTGYACRRRCRLSAVEGGGRWLTSKKRSTSLQP